MADGQDFEQDLSFEEWDDGLSDIPELAAIPDINNMESISNTGTGNVTDRVEVTGEGGDFSYINLTITGSPETQWDYTIYQSNLTNSLITGLSVSLDDGCSMEVEGVSVHNNTTGTIAEFFLMGDEENPVNGNLYLHQTTDFGVPRVFLDSSDLNGLVVQNIEGVSGAIVQELSTRDSLVQKHVDISHQDNESEISYSGMESVNFSTNESDALLFYPSQSPQSMVKEGKDDISQGESTLSTFFLQATSARIDEVYGIVESSPLGCYAYGSISVKEASSIWSYVYSSDLQESDDDYAERFVESGHELYGVRDGEMHYYAQKSSDMFQALSNVSFSQIDSGVEISLGNDYNTWEDNERYSQHFILIEDASGWTGAGETRFTPSRLYYTGTNSGVASYFRHASRDVFDPADTFSPLIYSVVEGGDESGYPITINGHSSHYSSPVRGESAALHGSWILEGRQGTEMVHLIEIERNGETIDQTESSSTGILRVYEDASFDQYGMHIT